MANTLLTPSVIASAALANLYENTVMANLVYRDYDSAFANGVGDTITVRKPTVFTAQEFVRTAGITIQNASETGIPVTLNHFADVSFAVTAEDLTLNITDFSMQFLNPAMEAISQKIDRDLLALRDDVTQSVGTAAAGPPAAYASNDVKVAINAGVALTAKNVPLAGRNLVLDPGTAGEWLADDYFTAVAYSGDTAALRDASLGRSVYGLSPYQTQNITDGVSVAFHPTAFALVTRPLALPPGAFNAAIQTYKGFGLRVVRDYDINKKQEIISIDTLYGTKTIDANRAVLIQAASGA